MVHANVYAKVKTSIIILVFIAGFTAMLTTVSVADEMPRISQEEAMEMLDDPEVIFLDVRLGTDWRASAFKIEGAERENPENIETWAEDYDKDMTYIVYCA